MVQKHEMIADFEKVIYNSEMLKDCWDKLYEHFKTLAHSRWTHHSILDFISYIQNNSYSSILFPGSSLGTLLISKPKEGYLNYQQTLEIGFDNTTGLFTMQYSDWDIINSESEIENAILWRTKCTGIELAPKFHDFLNWQKNWC